MPQADLVHPEASGARRVLDLRGIRCPLWIGATGHAERLARELEIPHRPP